jgi:hypothetical protein
LTGGAPRWTGDPFATRNIYKSVLNKLALRGYDFVAGLEVAGIARRVLRTVTRASGASI